ncbi:hypothetical protein [Escherichia coli]|uniref:glycine-rich domain-containing protein n=1 Tax=Escherichia coli TaxID=562 RepID=UPI002B272244|nr:hypothetical protein [Escherichia coli]
MANLPETPQWEEGIYQIEVSDPVLGGPDGISNRQGKQLASRTLYLKQQVEKGGSELAKHIAAADPHTQYAPKASPTFTGTPTAPTPANSDNSKKLATTEFVAKALAALAGSAPETLDTLKELADALGNDPNFATTVLNKLAEKLAKDQHGADIPDPALFVKNLGLGDGTGRLIAVYRIEASRKITLPPGTKFVVADLIGAGGGGGSNSTTVQPGYASAAQGGNSGSRVVAKFDGYEGQEIDVTIGAGGTGGVATPATGADGTTGGSTIVGTGIAATGGRGGIRGTAFNVLPTSGPTASPNADNTIANGVELIAQHTGHGGSSGFLFSDKNALGGKGADSEFGTGGVAIGISAGINASGGNNARGNGAGGSGAVSIYGTGSTGVSMPGGTGANGLAILWVYG